jgi:hypothetical protein
MLLCLVLVICPINLFKSILFQSCNSDEAFVHSYQNSLCDPSLFICRSISVQIRSGDSPCIHSEGFYHCSIDVYHCSFGGLSMFIYGYQRSYEVYDLAHILSIDKLDSITLHMTFISVHLEVYQCSYEAITEHMSL